MKRFLLAGMLALSTASFAQISLSHSAPVDDLNAWRKVLLDGGVEKLVVKSGSSVSLYNADYTLYKSFTVPLSLFPTGAQYYVNAVSNTLFDTDPADIEYLLVWYGSGSTGTMVLDETGTVLLNVLNFMPEGGFGGTDQYRALFVMNNQTMLRLKESGPAWPLEVRLYTLPGKEAVECCCNKNAPAKNKQGNDPMGPEGSGNMLPNPVSPGVALNYTLPEGVAKGELRITDGNGILVKTLNVGSQFSQVILDANALQSGTYYYQLFVDGQPRDGQVIMVVK